MTQKNLTTLGEVAEAAMPGLSPEEQRAGIVLLREVAKGEPVTVAQFAKALGVGANEAEALLLDEAFTLARRLNAQVFGPELARLASGASAAGRRGE